MAKYIAYIIGSVLLVSGGILFAYRSWVGGILICIGLITGIRQILDVLTLEREQRDDRDLMFGYLLTAGGKSPWLDKAMRHLKEGHPISKVIAFLVPLQSHHKNDPAFFNLVAGLLALQASELRFYRPDSDQRFSELRDRAAQFAAEGLKLDPNHFALWITHGIILDLQGRHKDAQAAFRESGHLRAGNSWWRRPLILSLSYTKDWSEGLSEIEALKKQRAEDWIFYYYSSAIYTGMGRYNTARKYLLKALSKRPKDPRVLDAIRQYSYGSGRMWEANKAEWRLLLIKPRWFWGNKRRFTEALVHTGVAFILWWQHRLGHRNLGRPYSTLARMAFGNKAYGASAVLFRVAYQKTHAIAHLVNSAAAMALAGHIDSAIRLSERVLTIAPDLDKAKHNVALYREAKSSPQVNARLLTSLDGEKNQ